MIYHCLRSEKKCRNNKRNPLRKARGKWFFFFGFQRLKHTKRYTRKKFVGFQVRRDNDLRLRVYLIKLSNAYWIELNSYANYRRIIRIVKSWIVFYTYISVPANFPFDSTVRLTIIVKYTIIGLNDTQKKKKN